MRILGGSFFIITYKNKCLLLESKMMAIIQLGSYLVKDLLLFSCKIVSDSFATLRTVAHQAPLSVGCSRQ